MNIEASQVVRDATIVLSQNPGRTNSLEVRCAHYCIALAPLIAALTSLNTAAAATDSSAMDTAVNVMDDAVQNPDGGGVAPTNIVDADAVLVSARDGLVAMTAGLGTAQTAAAAALATMRSTSIPTT